MTWTKQFNVSKPLPSQKESGTRLPLRRKILSRRRLWGRARREIRSQSMLPRVANYQIMIAEATSASRLHNWEVSSQMRSYWPSRMQSSSRTTSLRSSQIVRAFTRQVERNKRTSRRRKKRARNLKSRHQLTFQKMTKTTTRPKLLSISRLC